MLPHAFPGGRQAAERRLAAIDPLRYGSTRNHLDGAVTRLSPYIRHGVLTLAEVREAVFAKLEALVDREAPLQGELFGAAGSRAGGGDGGRLWSPAQRRAGERLISELGWRDYWQRLWFQLGDGIWEDREPLRTGHPPASYAADLPGDIAAAATGLACIDGFAGELMATGWLHNHARLWLASYVVHWRRVRWQAGARWFLQHLLDADPASNNLSWQWVASAFSQKPYIFNRANLERFGAGRFCACCPKARAGCPFEASYEALQARLFHPRAHGDLAAPSPASCRPSASAEGTEDRHGRGEAGWPWDDRAEGQAPFASDRPGLLRGSAVAAAAAPSAAPSPPAAAGAPPRRPLLWLHDEALGPANPALRAHPGAPALFVFAAASAQGSADQGSAEASAAGAGAAAPALSPLRRRFLIECLAELPQPLLVREGDAVATLLSTAAELGCDGIVTSRAVNPRLALIARRLAAVLPLQVLEPEPFVDLPLAGPDAPDLRRFSRYWRRAEPRLWSAVRVPPAPPAGAHP